MHTIHSYSLHPLCTNMGPTFPSFFKSSNPLLATLVPTISLAYGLQGLAAVPSILAQSERYYDLSGSLTYLSCTALSLYLPVLRNAAAGGKITSPLWQSLGTTLTGGRNWRQIALSAAVGIWATRLGTYLYTRISGDSGSDSRFDRIRTSAPKFAIAFFAQATWVSICLLPVLALNSIPSRVLMSLPRSVAITDILGLTLFTSGFGFEVLADKQKSAWVKAKREGKHNEDFLSSGLWSKSRHPNYFGEAVLWSGIAVTAGGVLARSAGLNGMGLRAIWQGRALGLALAAASPAFTISLLLYGSGVPLSEKEYDKRYGSRRDYQEWKKNTPVFWPKF